MDHSEVPIFLELFSFNGICPSGFALKGKAEVVEKFGLRAFPNLIPSL